MTKHDEKRRSGWPFYTLTPADWPNWAPERFAHLIKFTAAIASFVAALLVLAWFAGIVLALKEIGEALFSSEAQAYSNSRNAMLILAAVVGAPFVIWRTILAGRQVQINQEAHYTDLFTKAVEQLGADKAKFEDVERKVPEKSGARKVFERVQTTERNIEVRLGAIYALERVMADSKRDAGPIVETLSAYIRENCGNPVALDGEDWPDWQKVGDIDAYREAWRNFLKERLPEKRWADYSDVQAAFSVLSRRPEHARQSEGKKGEIFASLANANLQGGDLRKRDLAKADLVGAHLEGANLFWAHLEGANLVGAHLEGANLVGAHLKGANLLWAHLEGANLSDAHLEGANLVGAHLEGANLVGAHLEGANLFEAHLEGADLSSATLRGARLRSDFTLVAHLPEDFEAQLEACFGHKTQTKLPDGMDSPDHWFEGEDLREEKKAWEAFKASLSA